MISAPIAAVDPITIRRRGTGLTAHDPDRSAGGYTLIAPLTGNGNVYLVDPTGITVHQWTLSDLPGRHAVILPNGNLGYNGKLADTPNLYPAWEMWHGGSFSEVTPDGAIVWSHRDERHHHDGQWLPNGDLLYTTVEELPGNVAAQIVGGVALRDGTSYGDVVKRVDRSGTTIWQWRAWENLDPNEFPIHPIFDRSHWPLINGLFETRDGLVIMSLRTTSGVIAVDPASGRIVWKILHPMVSQQHAPVELLDGRILIFDNGNLRAGGTTPYSRAIEVDPQTGSIVWDYADSLKPAFFAPYMGSVDRLENGNTMIVESAFGRLFEVTPSGDLVWEYVVPHFAEFPEGPARDYAPGKHNSVFKAFRYSKARVPWL